MRIAPIAALVPALLLLVGQLPAQSAIWTPSLAPTSPPARTRHTLAYDSTRSVTVLYGGFDNNGYPLTDTWEYDGASWALRDSNGPSFGIYSSVAAAYDSQRQRTVLLLGDNGTTGTYEWDGTSWLLRTQGSTPPGRRDFSVAYDSSRGRTVLFGGISGSYYQSDTWEWDGTSWQQLNSGGPSPRSSHSMCFDSARGVTMLFGGTTWYAGNVLYYNDVWEWNGSYWFEHFGVASPAPRAGSGIAYDVDRNRTVIYGGGSNLIYYQETWEWDGASWAQVTTSGSPTNLTDPKMAYDHARQLVTLFGGHDTSLYAVLNGPSASFSTFGQGCGGLLAAPSLAAGAGSLPHLGTTLHVILGNLPNSPFNFPFGVIGEDNTMWNGQPLPFDLGAFGFTGCQAWIAPEFSVTLSNVGGTATWNIPIPFMPGLLGADFYLQGAVLAQGANPGGILFSNAGHLTVGLP